MGRRGGGKKKPLAREINENCFPVSRSLRSRSSLVLLSISFYPTALPSIIVLIEFRECGYFDRSGGGLEVTRAGVGKNGVSAPPVHHQSGIN